MALRNPRFLKSILLLLSLYALCLCSCQISRPEIESETKRGDIPEETSTALNEGAVILREVNISELFNGIEMLNRPTWFACDENSLYVMDDATGDVIKFTSDNEPEVLFTVEELFDRRTVKNIDANNGIVITAGAKNVYLFNNILHKYKNVYGIRYCRLINGDIVASCNTNFSIQDNIENHLLQVFDLDLKYKYQFGEIFIDYLIKGEVKELLGFVPVGNEIFVLTQICADAAYIDINNNIHKYIKINFPFSSEMDATNRKNAPSNPKEMPKGNYWIITFGVDSADENIYLLHQRNNDGYIYILRDDNINEAYRFGTGNYAITPTFSIYQNENTLYFIVSMINRDDGFRKDKGSKLWIFTEG